MYKIHIRDGAYIMYDIFCLVCSRDKVLEEEDYFLSCLYVYLYIHYSERSNWTCIYRESCRNFLFYGSANIRPNAVIICK